MESLEAYLQRQCQRVEDALERFLPPRDCYPSVLMEAMRYSVFAGGKRLRPILLLAATEAVGGESEHALPAACALECIHTYSMIHDDLPAMDDDDYRRGKLTNHKVYGDAMAILAGDALLTYAFELFTMPPLSESFPATLLQQAGYRLARAAGSFGMVGGQVMDIASEGQQVTLDVLEYIHRHKTAALIEASVTMGAVLGGGSLEQIQTLETYGHCVGWAFQIADDILDVEGDAAVLGKMVGQDAQHHKATYPVLLGLEESRRRANTLIDQGLQALDGFTQEAEPLRQIARYVVRRNV